MLISEGYRKLNKQLLAENPDYAIMGGSSRELVRPLCDWGRKPLLDYGAGRCTLAKALGPAYRVINYDPCVEGMDSPPEPCQVVYCGDVLEHIEPECLADVLADLYRVTVGIGLFVINIAPSEKTLADGRNAHLIVEKQDWWQDKLEEAGFDIVQMKPLERTIITTWFVVKRRVTQ